MRLRAGDWVEVRSKEEILRTLDKQGQLEHVPFMPQMFTYCGQRFKVYKSAHKTCDTVNPIRSLRVADAVHLELRCDGEAYGGCQAGCLIFWKTAWLKPVEGNSLSDSPNPDMTGRRHVGDGNGYCTEEDVWNGTSREAMDAGVAIKYQCQATQVPHYGEVLPWWDVRQYLEDYRSGNVGLTKMLRGGLFATYASFVQAGIGLGPFLSWVYDFVQRLCGGIPWPRRSGTIPAGRPTPSQVLNLQPGELVRVKSYKKILATLDTDARNRGLMWDRDMVPFCDGMYRVKTRLSRFVDEKSGMLISMKTPAVILEDVWCQARYSDCRMYCPRSIYSWWREIWLERIPDHSASARSNEASECRFGNEREKGKGQQVGRSSSTSRWW
jgi:hypothetical protein